MTYGGGGGRGVVLWLVCLQMNTHVCLACEEGHKRILKARSNGKLSPCVVANWLGFGFVGIRIVFVVPIYLLCFFKSNSHKFVHLLHG